MSADLTLAVSKGRILDESLPLLEKIGIVPEEDPGRSRKLVLQTSRPDIRIIIIRAADVPTYVEYGAADAGIAGRDILLEHDSTELYEPLDLNIARCRLVLAEPEISRPKHRHLRIATKYTHTTGRYFARQGRQVELIKLYGSMELAPVLGLADQIVDLVDTGRTLQANGLVPVETLCEISSRLIVNKVSMKTRRGPIRDLIHALAGVLNR